MSSYVGYSLEEPWGQPRVVFGVAADEAERLAALLDGHDCVGPVHAEITYRPDWRRAPAGDSGTSAGPVDDRISIPAQAPQPAADMFDPPSQAETAATTAETAENTAEVAPNTAEKEVSAVGSADSPAEATIGVTPPSDVVETGRPPKASSTKAPQAAGDTEPSGTRGSDGEASGARRSDAEASGTRGSDGEASGIASDSGGQAEPATTGDADQSRQVAPGASRPPKSRKAPAAPRNPVAKSGGAADADQSAEGPDRAEPDRAEPGPSARPAETAELSAPEQPGIVAFRRRPDQPLEASQELVPLPPPLTSSYDLMPDQGPGYRGPRYQGYPPQYQAGSDPDEPASSLAVAAPEAEDVDVAATGRRPQRTRSRQLSRLGRTRRQGPGAHEAWGSAGEEPAADHAV